MITFSRRGWDDYVSWPVERSTLRKINRMIEEARRDPAVGIGKPERLSQNLSGYWSRRITEEHRLVYAVEGGEIRVASCRYRY